MSNLVRDAVAKLGIYDVATGEDASSKLNQNESPFDVPQFLKERIVERVLSAPWNRYPSAHCKRLQTAIGQARGIPSECVLVGNGSNDIAHTVVSATVGSGDHMVLPTPMFFLYEKLARICSGAATLVPHVGSHFDFDADGIIDALEKYKPKLTVITTPNNPTGREMSMDDIRRVVDAASGVVLIDEAYSEFGKTKSMLDLALSNPNVAVLRTFSKAAALAGVRIGYLIGSAELVTQLRKARLPFMVNIFSEAAALVMLENEDWIGERVVAMKTMCSSLQHDVTRIDGVEVVPSATNFFLFKTEMPADALFRDLTRQGILIRKMNAYPEIQDYLRVSVGSADENRRFLRALTRIVRSNR